MWQLVMQLSELTQGRQKHLSFEYSGGIVYAEIFLVVGWCTKHTCVEESWEYAPPKNLGPLSEIVSARFIRCHTANIGPAVAGSIYRNFVPLPCHCSSFR